MRSHDKVVDLSQTRDEVTKDFGETRTVRSWFSREDVDSGTGEMSRLEGIGKSVKVDDLSTGIVDEVGTLLHGIELLLTDHVDRIRNFGNVEGNKVSLLEQILQSLGLSGGTERHDGNDIVVDDADTECFGEDG